MIEVGVRELKRDLSAYLRLVQKGEKIAITLRNKIVGFISDRSPQVKKSVKSPTSKQELKALKKKIEQWKKEGILISGGICRAKPVKPFKIKDFDSTKVIREMRDAD